MFDALATAVDELDVAPLGDEIRGALRVLDQLTAKVTAALARFDAAEGWVDDFSTSLTAWLRDHGQMTPAAAGVTAARADRCRRVPLLTEAWLDGRLCGSKVAVIVANVPRWAVALFDEHLPTLLPHLRAATLDEVTLMMQAWRERAADLLGRPVGTEAERELHHSVTLDGRFESKASWDAMAGAVIDAALKAATTLDGESEPVRSPGRKRADALVDICRSYLDTHATTSGAAGPRSRPHVSVVVTADELAHRRSALLVDARARIAASDVEALLCDCAVSRIVVDGPGDVLDVGRATRVVPPGLRHALALRDGGCRHPGCDRPASWCDAHHVVPWHAGGTTSIDNLVLKCSRHHHLAHRPGWRDELLPDGTYRMTTPAGRVIESRPRGPARGAAA